MLAVATVGAWDMYQRRDPLPVYKLSTERRAQILAGPERYW